MPELVHDVNEAVAWLGARGHGRLRVDSRLVEPGDIFFAWPGHARDGRGFVPQVLARGASACLVEAEGVQAFGLDDPRVAALAGLKAAAGEIASRLLGEPSRQLQVLAVTGTNGKTSTAWWYAQALRALGRRCAVVGTLGVGEPPAAPGKPVQAQGLSGGGLPGSGLTTPDALALQHALAGFVQGGVQACAVEASSIGLEEHRLAGTRIDVAVLTNFTRDHLDYHGTMDAYWAAKRRLFGWPGLRSAVVNVDDPMGERLAAELRGTRVACWTVSARTEARLVARQARIANGGLAFELHEAGERATVRTALIGDFNVHNLLGVAAALRASGVPLEQAAAALHELGPVPGRLQRVAARTTSGAGASAPAPEVVVDYAHTPDALEKVLQTLRPLAASRGGELWCVFGCGGDRDATKRPLMGAIAARLARHVVVTSDNPRSEDPSLIVSQVLAGMPEVAAPGRTRQAVPDRGAAIERAVAQAAAADVVLVAGKGHEAWQEVGTHRLPFSDVEVAHRALERRAARTQGVAA